jgi:RimJ/RimL family protein N-acetyltransferase
VSLPDRTIEVTFPAEWPGDALVFFPTLLAQYRRAPEDVPWGGTVIDPEECVAVGQIGFKHRPEHGAVEIGYNISPGYRNRGYATEVVEALTAWALAQPSVHRVTAECRVDNQGSIRVLEKTGFRRVGRYVDEEEGLLILWERTP